MLVCIHEIKGSLPMFPSFLVYHWYTRSLNFPCSLLHESYAADCSYLTHSLRVEDYNGFVFGIQFR